MSSSTRPCERPNTSTRWTRRDTSSGRLAKFSASRASDIQPSEHVGGGFVKLIGAADLFESAEQIVRLDTLLVAAAKIVQHRTTVHHHQAIAERGGLLHRVRHHERG